MTAGPGTTRRSEAHRLDPSSVNLYLVHKQRLLLSSRRSCTLVQAARDIVALHATTVTGPYLSLWARVPTFRRESLDQALYENKTLARIHCMRATLHLVPSDEVSLFLRAYGERSLPSELRDLTGLLVQAGLCRQEQAGAFLEELQSRVLAVVSAEGPATLRQIGRAVPELQARIAYAVGTSYAGEFSLGSRLLPRMCALGLLIRGRPRGSWRSNLYEYAALSQWFPYVDLQAVAPEEARSWLARRYLEAFGPATFEDVRWWTGWTVGQTREALAALEPALVKANLEGVDDPYLMLSDDLRRLREFNPGPAHSAFFLPALDPLIMGYRDRRRVLPPEHQDKIIDRAGNAVASVWLNGRVVGAWGQRKDGTVLYRLFKPVGEEDRSLIEEKRRQLDEFLAGEYLPPRTHTHFTRRLE